MAKQLRQARAVGRLVYNWFRYDLPEIVAPASMPDPPGLERPPRKTPAEMFALFKRACRRYVDTWDSAKVKEELARREGLSEAQRAQRQQQEGPTLAEEFALAAKSGSQALKPFLAKLYQTRVSAYRDAVQQFVQGYKAGFQEAMRQEVPPEVEREVAAAKEGAAQGQQQQQQQQRRQQQQTLQEQDQQPLQPQQPVEELQQQQTAGQRDPAPSLGLQNSSCTTASPRLAGDSSSEADTPTEVPRDQQSSLTLTAAEQLQSPSDKQQPQARAADTSQAGKKI